MIFQFYEAVIESVWPNLPTCFVTFVEYGNSEEVLLSDIRPMISALVSAYYHEEKGS